MLLVFNPNKQVIGLFHLVTNVMIREVYEVEQVYCCVVESVVMVFSKVVLLQGMVNEYKLIPTIQMCARTE